MTATFVLGSAADIAGTEQLYRLLADRPNFVAGHSESYHVLDGLGSTDDASAALADLREGRPAESSALHRIAMIGNVSLYYDYIAALLRRDPQRTLTADAAPEYAALPVETLTEVRRELEARGVRVVPVLVAGDQPEANDTWDAAFGDTVQYVPVGTPPQNV